MSPYQYVVLRCVPRADREEFLNVGVVVYCQEQEYLEVAWELDRARLAALGPTDLEWVSAGLRFAAEVCRGATVTGAVAGKDRGTRFGFLKAPRSTVVQPGPVHGGLTADPAATLLDLLDRLVR